MNGAVPLFTLLVIMACSLPFLGAIAKLRESTISFVVSSFLCDLKSEHAREWPLRDATVLYRI
jgi:hypothetical protein